MDKDHERVVDCTTPNFTGYVFYVCLLLERLILAIPLVLDCYLAFDVLALIDIDLCHGVSFATSGVSVRKSNDIIA